VSDSITYREQEEEIASYSCHRGPDDGEIRWSDSTRNIFNFIRAQSKPYAGSYTYFSGKKIYVMRARPRYDYSKYKGRIAGKVVSRDLDTNSVIILTGDGGIEVVEIRIDDREKLSPAEIFNSVRERCKSRSEAYLDTIGF